MLFFLQKNKDLRYTKPMTNQRNQIAAVVDTVEKDLWRKEGQKYAFETMKVLLIQAKLAECGYRS